MYIFGALFDKTVFTYLTARFAAVSKRSVHWVALNTGSIRKPWHVFIEIGTYCCVFITFLQVRIAAVQNSNIRGPSLKMNALSCWKYALHQTQPLTYSIVLCKTDIKTHLLMHPCYLDFLICRFELFCWTVVIQNSNLSSSPPKNVSVLRELPNKLTVYENP